jgi:hypothetical protein
MHISYGVRMKITKFNNMIEFHNCVKGIKR